MGSVKLLQRSSAVFLMACVAAISVACSEEQVGAERRTPVASEEPGIRPNLETNKFECHASDTVTLGPSQSASPLIKVTSEWGQGYLELVASNEFELIGFIAGDDNQQAFMNTTVGRPVRKGEPINLVADQFTGLPDITAGISRFNWLSVCLIKH